MLQNCPATHRPRPGAVCSRPTFHCGTGTASIIDVRAAGPLACMCRGYTWSAAALHCSPTICAPACAADARLVSALCGLVSSLLPARSRHWLTAAMCGAAVVVDITVRGQVAGTVYEMIIDTGKLTSDSTAGRECMPLPKQAGSKRVCAESLLMCCLGMHDVACMLLTVLYQLAPASSTHVPPQNAALGATTGSNDLLLPELGANNGAAGPTPTVFFNPALNPAQVRP